MHQFAYLGPPGTYSESAALCYLAGQPVTLIPQSSIQQVFSSILNTQVQRGIVPVENSVEGSVGLTLDSFWHLDGLAIQDAIELPIRHGLLGWQPDLSKITRVYSHPQALGQCGRWLEKHLPAAVQITTLSTSAALDHLAPDRPYCAIASQGAAQIRQIPILADGINDYAHNRTRFWVVGRRVGRKFAAPGSSEAQTITSFAFAPRGQGPGVLAEALQIFARRRINLTRIESRPSKRLMGEYVFFVDIEGARTEGGVREALRELQRGTEQLKFLGCYRVLKLGTL